MRQLPPSPFKDAPCTSELSREWMRAHRGASQWDFRIDGESDRAAERRRLRSKRLCESCPDEAKKACADVHAQLVTLYQMPIPGIWAGRIYRDGNDKPRNPNALPLFTAEEAA